MYPVEVAYLSEPSSDYVESAVQAVFDIHAKVGAVDLLSLSATVLSLSPLSPTGACRGHSRLPHGSGGDRQLYPGDRRTDTNVSRSCPDLSSR
jgi:hypothetical protein